MSFIARLRIMLYFMAVASYISGHKSNYPICGGFWGASSGFFSS